MTGIVLADVGHFPELKQLAHVPGQGGCEGPLLVHGGRHEERQYVAAGQDWKVAAHGAAAPGTSA